jgi:RNA polymerase sigma factor (sigma-70 family)
MGRGASIEAVERIYQERSRDFFRFAFAITGDAEFARDAVQEGFARALRSRASYKGSGSIQGWLARCVINAARDIVGGQDRVVPFDERDIRPADLPVAVDVQLRSAVRRLPARQREVLFLRFYLDLEYSAISEALGIEIGTVSATLHAARTQLARVLQEVAT